jgi:hypothetical protein
VVALPWRSEVRGQIAEVKNLSPVAPCESLSANGENESKWLRQAPVQSARDAPICTPPACPLPRRSIRIKTLGGFPAKVLSGWELEVKS